MGFVTENDLLFHTLYVIVTILSQTKSGYKAKRTSLRAVMYRFCTCEKQQVRLFALPVSLIHVIIVICKTTPKGSASD